MASSLNKRLDELERARSGPEKYLVVHEMDGVRWLTRHSRAQLGEPVKDGIDYRDSFDPNADGSRVIGDAEYNELLQKYNIFLVEYTNDWPAGAAPPPSGYTE